MKAGGPKQQNRKARGDTSATGYYVYCIAERDRLVPLFQKALPGAIEPGVALESVAQSELAAVVSPVPLADYGEEALETRLSDPTWTALRAMRHEKVVEHFARSTSVVPLRFGTLYRERAGIETMLNERHTDLLAIIEELRGREEWGVNVYCDRSILAANITQLSERLREMTQRADAATPGQSYLLRKKIETLRETEMRATIKRVAKDIEGELSDYGVAERNLRVLKDEATEHGELVAKLAFLVDQTRFDEFKAAAEQFAKEQASAGFQLELTGPWPAYNFATRG